MVMKFRNTSGEPRFVAELGRLIEDDELFTVPDDRAAAFDEQPFFTRDQLVAKTRKASE